VSARGAGSDAVAFVHGDLVVDVPASWSDQSTVLFVAQPQPSRSLHTQQAVDSLSLRTARLPPGGPAAMLVAERQHLVDKDPGFALLSEEPFSAALGDGVLACWRSALLGPALVQLVFAVAPSHAPDVGVLAVATTAEAGFEQARPRLLQLLASLRLRG
jgi:hypothetical protein